MEIEKKRALFFGGLIAFAIIFAVGYFFWGTVFDRGTLNVIAEPPFTIEKLGGELIKCQSSPCEIKLRSGDNELVLRKEGYQSLVEVADVKLWRTTDFPIDFQIIPQITPAEKFPKTGPAPIYELTYDNKYGKYKLVKEDDELAIVYFNNEIVDPVIFGSENYILIVEPKPRKTIVYKVDARTKSRDSFELAEALNIAEASSSEDGNYLVFKSENSEDLKILNAKDHQVIPLNLNLGLEQTSWTYGNRLVFATLQNFQSTSNTGKYGDYISFLQGEGNTLLFAAYNPGEDSFSELASFPLAEIVVGKVPDLLVTASSGGIIYLRADDQDYRLILKQY